MNCPHCAKEGVTRRTVTVDSCSDGAVTVRLQRCPRCTDTHTTQELSSDALEAVGLPRLYIRYRDGERYLAPHKRGQRPVLRQPEPQGTVRRPLFCRSWPEAFREARAQQRPLVVVVEGEKGRCFPSGHFEDLEGLEFAQKEGR